MSSVVSNITLKSLKACIKSLEEGIKQFAMASADISFAWKQQEAVRLARTYGRREQRDIVEDLLEM